MNTQEYLARLMQQSKNCECPSLADLFEKRRAAQTLEAKCKFFKGNADLENPQPQDRPFLKDYILEAKRLKAAATNYHKYLYSCALDNHVYFKLHEPEKFTAPKKIDLVDSVLLMTRGDKIISIHCSSCNQQIDLAGSYF